MLNSAQRDLDDYTAQFESLPFEPIQAGYRRRRVLAEISKFQPRRLLEVGCGDQPLFTALHGMEVMVVEPAMAFATHARSLARDRPDTQIVQARLEDIDEDYGMFDMVVISCLLHEVEDPQALLASARRLCTLHTVLHVNVPNAHSLHRQLAMAMGLIKHPGELSATQRAMQQRATYDTNSLTAELTQAGFTVQEQGSLFVKPFTHAQMQSLVDSGFLNAELLNGLDQLANTLPSLGSEIWCNARLTHD